MYVKIYMLYFRYIVYLCDVSVICIYIYIYIVPLHNTQDNYSLCNFKAFLSDSLYFSINHKYCQLI